MFSIIINFIKLTNTTMRGEVLWKVYGKVK